MKTHQPIIVVTLSCLLMLTSACGKQSVRGVSGVEDLFSSEGNHEVTSHDKALYGDPLVQLGETSLGDGWDAGAVEALSAADLHDEKSGTAFAGGGQGGSSSVFPVSMRSRVSGSSGGALGMGNSKGMSRTGDQFTTSASSGTSAAHEDARKNSTHVSQGLRDVFFAYDSWRLAEKSHRILESNAEWLKAHPHARITIEGHCDERGNAGVQLRPRRKTCPDGQTVFVAFGGSVTSNGGGLFREGSAGMSRVQYGLFPVQPASAFFHGHEYGVTRLES